MALVSLFMHTGAAGYLCVGVMVRSAVMVLDGVFCLRFRVVWHVTSTRCGIRAELSARAWRAEGGD